MVSKFQVAAALLAATTASLAHAEQKAAKIAVTASSGNAAIIFKAPDLPKPMGSYISSYKVGFKKYDPVNQALQGGPYSGSVLVSARPSLFTQGYLVSDLKPGTYVVTDLSRQDLWALCFYDNSLQFTVKPGEVLYLGELDAAYHVMELEFMAIKSGKTSLRQGRIAHFFDNITPPRFKAGTAEDLVAVAGMMKSTMPNTTVIPSLVYFQPARFGTGHDLFGTGRICGGYYTGNAKEKPAASD